MARLERIVPRRLSSVLRARLEYAPVVVLTGARAVGKSVLLRDLASACNVAVVDLDDLDTRSQVDRDPGLFVLGDSPIVVDEFRHVPAILDAIKAELNQDTRPGRFVAMSSSFCTTSPSAVS
jgi:hypothetical protein